MTRIFSRFSVRTKLFVASLLVTLAAMFAVGWYFLERRQEAIDYLTQQMLSLTRVNAEVELGARAENAASQTTALLRAVEGDVSQTAQYAAMLLGRSDLLEQSGYWNARDVLKPLAQGQLDNPNDEPGSVFVPPHTSLSTPMEQELNSLKYLDFVVPNLLKANTDVVGLYFVGANGEPLYYPNIDLAAVVGDYDPTSQPYYVNATPEKNPTGQAVWSAPYRDSAGTGLIVTVSKPVYDTQGMFRGVIGADVQLAKISQAVTNLKVGETGYSFLVDSAGRIIGMPDRGYSDFGLTPETVSPNEAPEQTVLGKGDTSLQDATDKMRRGGTGVNIFRTADGADHYIAFTRVPIGNYSLGMVVPVNETTGQTLSAIERLAEETRGSTVTGLMLFGIIAAIVIVIMYFVARTLTRPLAQLTKTAQEITAGNLEAEALVMTHDEIGTLALVFNSMTAQLRDVINSLETRVELRTAQIQASADVGQAAASILDPDQLLDQVVRLISERFGFYYAAAFIIDPSGKWAVLREAKGPGDAARVLKQAGHRLELDGNSMVAASIRRRRPRIALDVGEEAVRFANPLLPDTRSEIALPLVVGDQVLGALDVQSVQPAAFDEASTSTLQAMTDQVAVALNNARQYRREQLRAQQTTGLLEASIELTAQTDQSQAYELIGQLAMSLLTCDGVGVWLPVEEDEIELRYTVNVGRIEMTGRRLRRGEGLSGQVFAKGIALRVDDYLAWSGHAASFDDAPFHAALGVPLIWQGQTAGVLVLTRSQPGRPFVADDENIAQLFAAQAIATLENTRLLAQVQTALEELSQANKRLTGEAWQIRLRGESIAHEYRRTEHQATTETTLQIPVELRGQRIGSVTLEDNQPERELTSDERSIVENVVQQMALALESARLFEQTQSALSEARRLALREQLINRIVGQLRGAISVDEVLRIATDEMRRAMRATYASARLTPAGSAIVPDGNGQGYDYDSK